MESNGCVLLSINLISQGLQTLGYDVGKKAWLWKIDNKFRNLNLCIIFSINVDQMLDWNYLRRSPWPKLYIKTLLLWVDSSFFINGLERDSNEERRNYIILIIKIFECFESNEACRTRSSLSIGLSSKFWTLICLNTKIVFQFWRTYFVYFGKSDSIRMKVRVVLRLMETNNELQFFIFEICIQSM